MCNRWADRYAAPSGGKSISVCALVRKYGKTIATLDILVLYYLNYTALKIELILPYQGFN
jgi:hypothetical protein